MRVAPAFLQTAVLIALALLGGNASVWGQSVATPENAIEAESPELVQARAEVARLGAADFEEREAAAERLREIGVAGVAALEAGLDEPDPEIRTRCQRLLSEVYDLEREQLIADFIAGIEQPDAHLPSWNRFREQFGNDVNARKMYLTMMREEWDLLMVAEESREAMFQQMAQRCSEIQYGLRMQRQEVPLGSVAAMLFLSSEQQDTPQFITSMVYSFCFQNTFAQVLQGGDYQELARKLVGRWVEEGAGSIGSYESLMLAMRYNLEEGLVPAAAMLRDAEAPPQVKQLAMVTLAKLGDERHLALVEPFLEDETVTTLQQNGQARVETQLRDVALVAQIYLRDADPADFGFDRLIGNDYILFNPASIGFADEESREASFAKWRQYQQDHPFG